LPEPFFLFISRFTPLVNVDLIVRDEQDRILLTWRDDEFYGAGWHIPGGIIRYKESAADRIHATALNELGTDVEFEEPPLAVEQATEPERRERGHFVALVYACRLAGPPDERLQYRGGVPRRGEWAWHKHCPPDFLPAQSHYRRFFSCL
jgi:colanic acid biosynthesis protein WcaH